MQVWRVPAVGGDAEQVTKLPIDVEGVLPFADGKRLLLTMAVYPDAKTVAETAKRDQALTKQEKKKNEKLDDSYK